MARSFCGLSLLLGLLGCPSLSSSPADNTRRYFERNRGRFVAVRDMLVADYPAIKTIGASPIGGLSSVTGAKGWCGSELRGGEFPWACGKGGVARDLAEAAASLGVSKNRLEEYARLIPAKSAAYHPAAGATFGLVDSDSRPGESPLMNIYWSKDDRPSNALDLGAGWLAL